MKYNLTFILTFTIFILLPGLAFFYDINRGNESCELVSADSGNQDKLPLFLWKINMPKYCECGCGNLAPLCTITNKKRGCVKGETLRFIQGHSNKGENDESTE